MKKIRKWKIVGLAVCLILAMSCLFGCAPAAEESSTGSQTQEQSPAADQSSASGGTDAAASDVPYAKLGTMDISATGKINVSVVENVDYIAANMPNGGEFILEIDSLTDPESMISNIEKLIAAGCNGLTVCAVNDAMLIKVAQLCEEAGVYWAVIYREIIDEEVREVVYNSPYFVGTVVQDDERAGYDVAKAMADSGMKKVGLISLDKSSSTSILRERGIAKACEETGMEIVAEARDLAQATDAAQAVESFMTANPDLDGVMIAASMGVNILDGVINTLEQYDPEGNVKVGLIDFVEGMDSAFDKGRIVVTRGGIFVPTVTTASMLILNAITDGERMEGEAHDIKVNFGEITTMEEFENFDKYVEGQLPWYTYEEVQQYLKVFNPDVTAKDITEMAESFNLAELYERHADLEPPVPGPNKDYVGYVE